MVNIVLVDDHKIILDGVSALLNSENSFNVLGKFLDPKKACAFLENKQVDVILTDLDMPIMKGEDVLAFCKSKFPNLKIIVLSMHNEKSVIKHLIELGADGYLMKSAGKEEIITAIKSVLQNTKYFADDVLKSLIAPETEKPTNTTVLKELTNREIEIIKLISGGLSSKEIGENLFISPRTVDTHRNNLLRKLETNGIAGIIRFAFENKLVE